VGRFAPLVTSMSDEMTFSYHEGASRDSWGKDFYYSGDKYGYTLKSYGKDKKPGAKGEFDNDIVYINGSFVAPSSVVAK
jgi:hypothetical protein